LPAKNHKLPDRFNICILAVEIRKRKFLISKSVLLILAEKNFNEEEYLIIINALERAGVKIFIASDSHSLCVGSQGLKVKNDVHLFNVHECNFNGLILIGGNGMRDYWNNSLVQTIAQKFAKSKKVIGAICSAPIILAKAELLIGCSTCYPEDKPNLEKEGINYKDVPVVVQKNIITAQNPAAAPEFIKTFLYELTKTN
jgi:protease I